MSEATGKYVGEEIRALRTELGLSQSEVCRAWGRPQPNLSEIEHNRRRISESGRRLLVATMTRLAEEKTASHA